MSFKGVDCPSSEVRLDIGGLAKPHSWPGQFPDAQHYTLGTASLQRSVEEESV